MHIYIYIYIYILNVKKNEHPEGQFQFKSGWSVVFYCLSTLAGYLIQNPVYTYTY